MSQSMSDHVQASYAGVARGGVSGSQTGIRAVAQAFGYSADELATIPETANLGLSCGNPTAMASLRPGEVVVDLGCGGGIDVLLAARQVGPTGRVHGVDMTEEMLELARRNAASAPAGPIENVEFHLARIDDIPLDSGSVDCILSNCVINLAEDKAAVFREMARVLKPGGRLAISDIALKQALPEDLENDIAAFVGCIAGAILIDDYKSGLRDAGFAAVEVIDSGADLNAYRQAGNQTACCSGTPTDSKGLNVLSECCAPSGDETQPLHERLAKLLERYEINDYAASVKVLAVRPESASHGNG